MSNIDFLKDKFFYKDFKALKELEKTLFNILLNIPDYSFHGLGKEVFENEQ